MLTRSESRSLSRHVLSTLGDPRDPRRTEAEQQTRTEDRRRGLGRFLSN